MSFTWEQLCHVPGLRHMILFKSNSNIDNTCLNRSKLHLNKSGTSLQIKTFSKIVNSIWIISKNDNNQVLNLLNSSIVSFSRVSDLPKLRSKNADNIIFCYLNINSIRNRFENLCELVAGNVNILFYCGNKTGPFLHEFAILNTWFS